MSDFEKVPEWSALTQQQREVVLWALYWWLERFKAVTNDAAGWGLEHYVKHGMDEQGAFMAAIKLLRGDTCADK